MNPQNLSPDLITAAIGAVLGFIFAVLTNLISQTYLDRRNKVQLTFFKRIETPLNISQKELRKKLEISYNNREVEEIYYAKLVIKNTGRKTVKKQIFSCVFDQNSKSIDSKFPIITTTPDMEVPVKNVSQEDSDNYQPNRYRYMIEAIAPEQSIEIEFLRDGTNKSFDVPFAPNGTDEVKTIEGSLSTDTGMEVHIVQIAFNYFVYTAILKIGNAFGFLGGSLFGVFLALPFLYNAFVAFRKLVPLFIENILQKSNSTTKNTINVGNDAQPGIVIGDGGSVIISPSKKQDDENEDTDSTTESKPQKQTSGNKKKSSGTNKRNSSKRSQRNKT